MQHRKGFWVGLAAEGLVSRGGGGGGAVLISGIKKIAPK